MKKRFKEVTLRSWKSKSLNRDVRLIRRDEVLGEDAPKGTITYHTQYLAHAPWEACYYDFTDADEATKAYVDLIEGIKSGEEARGAKQIANLKIELNQYKNEVQRLKSQLQSIEDIATSRYDYY